MKFPRNWRRVAWLGAAIAGLAGSPLAAQMQTIDPDTQAAPSAPVQTNTQVDGDLVEAPGGQDVYANTPEQDAIPPQDAAPTWSEQSATEATAIPPATTAAGDTTYHEDDLIGAAEGVFGKGAEGVAKLIQKLLKDQGEPNGYIIGREAGGAVGIGVRYGSGTLYHKVEGEQPVYWTGPSIGFDLGANAGSTFVLVYNLYDTEELYERYPAGEGQAYAVGGLTASYLRKGDVVLIPIRVGAGLRLGINAGYMKFSHEQKWLPF